MYSVCLDISAFIRSVWVQVFAGIQMERLRIVDILNLIAVIAYATKGVVGSPVRQPLLLK